MDLTPDAIAQLKQRYGELYQLTAEDPQTGLDESVVVRRPTRPEYASYRDQMADDDRRTGANKQLLYDCCVWPDRGGVDEMLDRLPGLAETFGLKCATLAGMTRNVAVAKL